jgi:hypothetical protein
MKKHDVVSEIIGYSHEFPENYIEKLSEKFEDFTLLLFKKEFHAPTQSLLTTIKFSHTIEL